MPRFIELTNLEFNISDPAHRQAVIDACKAQTNHFDCMTIRRFIGLEIHKNGQTFTHHKIASFLGLLADQGVIKFRYWQDGEYDQYVNV